MEPEDELIPTRQTLLSRLKDWDDRDSWNDFFQTYWKLIYKAALKSGLNEAEAQDVVQETIISVSKQMPHFKYDPKGGSFKNWLLQLTRWRIADHWRKRHTNKVSNQQMPPEVSLDQIPDPEASAIEMLWNEEWEKTLLEAAIERIKRSVDPKQYQMFDLYVMKEWPLRKVASTLQVNPGRIYLAKHRILGLIKKEIKYLEEQML